MCKVLSVSRSGFYAWRCRPISQREMENRQLVEQIKTEHRKSSGTYGSPRIYHAVMALGRRCSVNRVARLMKRIGIQAKQAKRFKATTKRDRTDPVAPNRLRQVFSTDHPDSKWVADTLALHASACVTYFPTLEGWLYLAAILDLYSRRIDGWAMSARMTGDLTLSALEMALRQRRPARGLIHHSDQGSQYTDRRYQALLAAHGIRASMNSVGSWYDNAPMESFFGTLKNEHVYHCTYHSRLEAATDLFFYIEGFYNRRRLHSGLGYTTPEAFERSYYVARPSPLTVCP